MPEREMFRARTSSLTVHVVGGVDGFVTLACNGRRPPRLHRTADAVTCRRCLSMMDRPDIAAVVAELGNRDGR